MTHEMPTGYYLSASRDAPILHLVIQDAELAIPNWGRKKLVGGWNRQINRLNEVGWSGNSLQIARRALESPKCGGFYVKWWALQELSACVTWNTCLLTEYVPDLVICIWVISASVCNSLNTTPNAGWDCCIVNWSVIFIRVIATRIIIKEANPQW